MAKTVLKVENVSKLYRLGEVGTGTISHDLNRWWHKVRGKEDPYQQIGTINQRDQKGDTDYVWALKDINLEVKEGEILGIIGANGAGKSTLLKILSKVTAPTTGRIRGKGKISALLEVGTGFHPELTARDNIYLNGAILGMRRHEITAQLDEIVDFAGIERYLDTPVKRFSSGMTVRLGFAVAAHLRTDILIVDEVLAVGDVEFQKKCIGKIGEISEGQGKTVLFVSHNMTTSKELCNNGILLKNGKVAHADKIKNIINKYQETYFKNLTPHHIFAAQKSNTAAITSIQICKANGVAVNKLEFGEDFQIIIDIKFNITVKSYHIVLFVKDALNNRIFTSRSENKSFFINTEQRNKTITVRCKISSLKLLPNNYFLVVKLFDKKGDLISIKKNIPFQIEITKKENFKFLKNPGIIKVDANWSSLEKKKK